MSGPFLTEHALTGVRLGLIILYGLLLMRLLTDSWSITEQPKDIRTRAWRWWRGGVAALAVSVIAFYSPADILSANRMIATDTRQGLSLAGSILNAVCAVLLLVGLDVANGRKARAFPFYLAILAVPILWATGRG